MPSGRGRPSLRLMPVKAGGIVGLVAAVLTLTGCGSASYSVGQVESAFAAHGIPLARETSPSKGVVELANFPDGVVVLVDSSGGPYRGGYFITYYSDRIPPSSPRPTLQGNLTVYAAPRHADAVKAALRQLRH